MDLDTPYSRIRHTVGNIAWPMSQAGISTVICILPIVVLQVPSANCYLNRLICLGWVTEIEFQLSCFNPVFISELYSTGICKNDNARRDMGFMARTGSATCIPFSGMPLFFDFFSYLAC